MCKIKGEDTDLSFDLLDVLNVQQALYIYHLNRANT